MKTLRTLHPISYAEHGLTFRAEIPAGTPVRPATDLLGRGYYVQPWKGILKRELRYLNERGMIVLPCEVGEDLPGLE